MMLLMLLMLHNLEFEIMEQQQYELINNSNHSSSSSNDGYIIISDDESDSDSDSEDIHCSQIPKSIVLEIEEDSDITCRSSKKRSNSIRKRRSIRQDDRLLRILKKNKQHAVSLMMKLSAADRLEECQQYDLDKKSSVFEKELTSLLSGKSAANDYAISKLIEYNEQMFRLIMHLEDFLGTDEWHSIKISKQWIWSNKHNLSDSFTVPIPKKPKILHKYIQSISTPSSISSHKQHRNYTLC